MYLVNKYVGHENVTTIDVRYHGNLMLPLMLEAYKLLIVKGLQNLKSLSLVRVFKICSIYFLHKCKSIYKEIVLRELYSFDCYPIDAKTCNCALTC
jgi:hypothetical protein